MKQMVIVFFLLCSTALDAQIIDRADKELAECAQKVIVQIGDVGSRLALIRVANAETGVADRDCEKIADHLQSGLVNAGRGLGKVVVTRDSVELVASETEIDFSMSTWVDQNTRLEAGKKLSADVLVIGKYDPDERQVLVRAIHVTTGTILVSVFCHSKDLEWWEMVWRFLAIFMVAFVLFKYARNRTSVFCNYRVSGGAVENLGFNTNGKIYVLVSFLTVALMFWFLLGTHFMS